MACVQMRSVAGTIFQHHAGRDLPSFQHGSSGTKVFNALEAVVREQELILEHRPSCNVYGRRPEHYAYVKVAGNGEGLRLYATERAADLQQRGVPLTTAKGQRFSTVVGPFRGRTRVHASLELITRCYPIRRCHGVPKGTGVCTGRPSVASRPAEATPTVGATTTSWCCRSWDGSPATGCPSTTTRSPGRGR